MRTIRFGLNGAARTVEIPDHLLLVDLLQDRLHLTGCRESCGQGVCGACTVLVDGAAVSACLLLAAEVDGREVTTVEGLAAEPQELTGAPAAGAPAPMHPVQEAFLRHFAFQCGYCTPGMILTVLAYLREGASAIPPEEYLRGNLCRCGCYREIIDALTELSGSIVR